MRIAQIAPIAEKVPPKKYGGTERVVYHLTEELVSRGHQVTLFATKDSITNAQLKSVYPNGLRETNTNDPHGLNPWTLLNIGYAYSLQEEFDIIHDHNSPISLPTANISQTPVVMTIHSAITEINKKLLKAMDKPNFVAISDYQLKQTAGLNFLGKVHNGLDFSDYPFSDKAGEYLLFVGRASPEKGLHIAIEVAEILQMKLLIAAKLDEVDRDYFKTEIAPRLSRQIVWIGEVEQSDRNQLYAGALALLHPVTWPEPFGLTMVEAMATGTPVVALREGSVTEIVKNGISGYVADSTKDMIELIPQIVKIDRRKTRDYALNYFNSKLMTDLYERIYQQVLSQSNIRAVQNPTQLPFLLGNGSKHSQKFGNGARHSSFRKR